MALARIRPERREWRFYRIEIWQDLFGSVLLARRWGRIGTEGRLRFDFHADRVAAFCPHPSRRRQAPTRLPGDIS